MADNKFILRLKGTKTAASVVEVKDDKITAPFAKTPLSSNDIAAGIIDDKDSSVVVAKGSQNWKVNGGALQPTDEVAGDGRDYTSENKVAGDGMWLNASYTFPPTGSETQPVAQVFLANSKWVLKLCGKDLMTTSGDTIEFTFVVKIGSTNIASNTITVHKQANFFCKKFVVDFSESAKEYIAGYGGTNLTLQLFCSDENASATIFNGMTVLTCLERRVDATAVASKTRVLDKVFDEGLLPSEYFSNGNFIDQVEDNDTASPVFIRDGAQMKLDGWIKQQDMSSWIEKVEEIESVIPDAASPTNQLADKAFVNSSVQTATANFRGNWATWTDVPTTADAYPVDYAGSKTPTVNDYLVVADASGFPGQTLVGTWRFKYSGTWTTDGKNGWLPEYQVNEEPLTMAQLAALNSGVSAVLLDDMQADIDRVDGKTAELDGDLQGKVDKAQGVENAGKYLKVGDDGNVTFGEGEDLTNVAKTNVSNNFTMPQTITTNSDAGFTVKSPSSGGYLYVTRGSGTSAVTMAIKSGASGGTFGTITNHQFQFRTFDVARMTIGTDGSVKLNQDVESTSNDNQVATTKWVNQKIGQGGGGVTEVAHDDTLTGKGTTEEPLSVVKPSIIIRRF